MPLAGVAGALAAGRSRYAVAGSATRPVLRSIRMASFQAEPSALTLKWKSSSPAVPISARPEKPVWNSRLAVSPAAFLLILC